MSQGRVPGIRALGALGGIWLQCSPHCNLGACIAATTQVPPSKGLDVCRAKKASSYLLEKPVHLGSEDKSKKGQMNVVRNYVLYS